MTARHPREVIAEAYGLVLNGELSWEELLLGADQAVCMLIDEGLCPPEFDARS
jgi:hypothetical protein